MFEKKHNTPFPMVLYIGVERVRRVFIRIYDLGSVRALVRNITAIYIRPPCVLYPYYPCKRGRGNGVFVRGKKVRFKWVLKVKGGLK